MKYYIEYLSGVLYRVVDENNVKQFSGTLADCREFLNYPPLGYTEPSYEIFDQIVE